MVRGGDQLLIALNDDKGPSTANKSVTLTAEGDGEIECTLSPDAVASCNYGNSMTSLKPCIAGSVMLSADRLDTCSRSVAVVTAASDNTWRGTPSHHPQST